MGRCRLCRIGRDTAGTTTLEFGITGLCFVLLIIGIVEAGVLLWSWQALESTVADVGRCASINAPSCLNPSTTPANTQNYAVTTALARGLPGITTGNVTVTTGAAAQTVCGTTATVVSIAMSYQFGISLLAPLPNSISASACFPSPG